jgi:hypothetical protein
MSEPENNQARVLSSEVGKGNKVVHATEEPHKVVVENRTLFQGELSIKVDCACRQVPLNYRGKRRWSEKKSAGPIQSKNRTASFREDLTIGRPQNPALLPYDAEVTVKTGVKRQEQGAPMEPGGGCTHRVTIS